MTNEVLKRLIVYRDKVKIEIEKCPTPKHYLHPEQAMQYWKRELQDVERKIEAIKLEQTK